jgi:hypothetical protein
MRDTGRLLFFVGLALAGIGLLAGAGALSWFGRLPGDIRIVSDNVRVYIPITSMVLVSLVMTRCAVASQSVVSMPPSPRVVIAFLRWKLNIVTHAPDPTGPAGVVAPAARAASITTRGTAIPSSLARAVAAAVMAATSAACRSCG